MIPFNKPNTSPNAIKYLTDSISSNKTSGDGKYTNLCVNFLNKKFQTQSCLITHSCTASLEIAAILLDAKIGDEIIIPSYTFVSTANAFVLRGLKPVFVDIRDDNCNIDENEIEKAITKKTRAIVVVHYGGVACDMDRIMQIAKKYNLHVIEDSAQSYDSYFKNKHLGTIGDIGCFSFHETKNIISGEGGAFITNNEKFSDRAHIIREKGTNRTKFYKGLVDKYSWIDIGSSYLPSDLISAYLYSNLEIDQLILKTRINIWNFYFESFKKFQNSELIKLPTINDYATNNAHLFYIRFKNESIRDNFINFMKENKILTPFHYLPLHSSISGKKYGRSIGDFKNTNNISQTIVRLPLFFDLHKKDQEKVIDNASTFLKKL